MINNSSIKNLVKYLKIEAIKRVKNKHELILVESVNVNNFTMADIDSLNLMIYGSLDGHFLEKEVIDREARKYSDEMFHQLSEEKRKSFSLI